MRKLVLGALFVTLLGCAYRHEGEAGYKFFEQSMRSTMGYNVHMKKNQFGNYQWKINNGTFTYFTKSGIVSYMVPKLAKSNSTNALERNLALGACYGIFISVLGLDPDTEHPELESTSNALLYNAWDESGLKRANYEDAELTAISFSTHPSVFTCTITP